MARYCPVGFARLGILFSPPEVHRRAFFTGLCLGQRLPQRTVAGLPPQLQERVKALVVHRIGLFSTAALHCLTSGELAEPAIPLSNLDELGVLHSACGGNPKRLGTLNLHSVHFLQCERGAVRHGKCRLRCLKPANSTLK